MHTPAPVEMTSAVDSLASFFFLSSAIIKLLMILNRQSSVPVYSAGTTKVRILGHSTWGKQGKMQGLRIRPWILLRPHRVFPSDLEHVLSPVTLFLFFFALQAKSKWNHEIKSPRYTCTFRCEQYRVLLSAPAWVCCCNLGQDNSSLWRSVLGSAGSLASLGSTHQVPPSPLSVWQAKVLPVLKPQDWRVLLWERMTGSGSWVGCSRGWLIDLPWRSGTPGVFSQSVSYSLGNSLVLMDT